MATALVGELPVGRRVAYWRDRRGLNQQQFADRLGKSKSWVDKVERGIRRLDKFSVLQEIAETLKIDVRLLVGASASAAAEEPTVTADAAAVRAALFRYSVMLDPTTGRRTAPELAELKKAVTHAWLSYQRADYGRLLRALPDLLGNAQLARAQHCTGQSSGLLGQVYMITSAALHKVGELHSAWLAADRGMAVAAGSGDPLLAACAAVPLSSAVRDLGQPRQAMEVAVVVAHRLAAPNPLAVGPDELSVYGTLLLQAAMAAACCGDEPSVAELIDQAAAAALLVGEGQNHYWTSFGPTTVSLARIAATVALGGAGRTVKDWQEHVGSSTFKQLPPGRRAGHLVTMARALLDAGDSASAGQALVIADSTAQDEVRSRPSTHELMTMVMRHNPRPAVSVVRLADEMGIRI